MIKLNLSHRVEKLEAATAPASQSQIPVWCEEREAVPDAVDRMVARRQIGEADRERCVFWADWRGAPVGSHEAVISLLERRGAK